jgi:polar amino acid transport system substrate-binding protein
MRDPKTGEWSGVYIDIMRMLADQLGVKLQVVDTTWDDLVAGLVAGKWDIAPALNRTVKRSLVVNYSIAAHAYQLSFVFNKNNKKIDGSWISLADFDKPGCMLFWALLASGQISLRRVDGWNTLHVPPAGHNLDLAA